MSKSARQRAGRRGVFYSAFIAWTDQPGPTMP